MTSGSSARVTPQGVLKIEAVHRRPSALPTVPRGGSERHVDAGRERGAVASR